MGQNDIIFPGAHNERLQQKAAARNKALASNADLHRLAGETSEQLQQIATQAGLGLAALQTENRTRQQEIAQWAVEHIVLLRLLVRAGVITEADLAAQRDTLRAEVEAAQDEQDARAAPDEADSASAAPE